MMLNPLPDDKILDWSKLKQSADHNFEFDVKSKNFFKLVENTMVSHGHQKVSLCGNGLTLSQISPGLHVSAIQVF